MLAVREIWRTLDAGMRRVAESRRDQRPLAANGRALVGVAAWPSRHTAAVPVARDPRRWRLVKELTGLAGVALLWLPLGTPAVATEIKGSIHVTHRLTKRPVAPVASSYHRGVAVALPPQEQDFVQAELDRVVVYLDEEAQLPSEAKNAVLKQKDRRFAEDTIVVPAGSSVTFPNLDPIFHNVFSLSKAKSFDLGNYPQNDSRTVTFPKPGIVRVYCHLHPNMSASIVVTPNRWAVKPDSAGRYKLPDVPAGEHTVIVWHKSAGFFRERIRLAEGQSAVLNFTIPVEAGSQMAADR